MIKPSWKTLFIALMMLVPSYAKAEFGDIDLTYNVYTKHVNDKDFYTHEDGFETYEEDNNHIGIRFGIDDYRSVGASYGINSFGERSWVLAAEFTYPFHKYLKAGVMTGFANGYEKVSSNGWTFVGGPSIRVRTPYIGATATLYAADALVVTVDIPISTSLR